MSNSESAKREELVLEIKHARAEAAAVWDPIGVDRNWLDEATKLFPIAGRLGLPNQTSLYNVNLEEYLPHFREISDYSRVRGSTPLEIVERLTDLGIWSASESPIFKFLNLEHLFLRATNFRGLATMVLDQGNNVAKLNQKLNRCVRIPEKHIHGLHRESDRYFKHGAYEIDVEEELTKVRQCMESNTVVHGEILSRVAILQHSLAEMDSKLGSAKASALTRAGIQGELETQQFEAWYLDFPHKTQSDLAGLVDGSSVLLGATVGIWKSGETIKYCWECLEYAQESHLAGLRHLADDHLNLDTGDLLNEINSRFLESWNFFGLNESQRIELMENWAQDESWFTNIHNLLLQLVTIDPTTHQTAEDSERLENEILPRLGISDDDFTAFLTSHKKLFERLGVRRTAFIQWFCRLPESLEQNLIGEAIKEMRGKQNEL